MINILNQVGKRAKRYIIENVYLIANEATELRSEVDSAAELYYLCSSRDFVNQHFFLLLDLHWDSPKLSWGMQRICGPFVLKTIIMPFKRLFVLWQSLIRSLYNIPPHSCALFTHFSLHQFFSYVFCHLSLMTLLLGV